MFVRVPGASKVANAPGHSAVSSRLVFMHRCPRRRLHRPAGQRRLAHRHVEHRRAARSRSAGFTQGDAVWDEMVACVRDDVRAVQHHGHRRRSGHDVPHFENMVGGKAERARRSDLGECRRRRAVRLRRDPERDRRSRSTSTVPTRTALCWTAAQEIAHAFGLEHEFNAAGSDDVPRRRPAEAVPGDATRRAASSTEVARATAAARRRTRTSTSSTMFGPGVPTRTDASRSSAPTDGKQVAAAASVVRVDATDDVAIERVELCDRRRRHRQSTTHDGAVLRDRRADRSTQGPHTRRGQARSTSRARRRARRSTVEWARRAPPSKGCSGDDVCVDGRVRPRPRRRRAASARSARRTPSACRHHCTDGERRAQVLRRGVRSGQRGELPRATSRASRPATSGVCWPTADGGCCDAGTRAAGPDRCSASACWRARASPPRALAVER